MADRDRLTEYRAKRRPHSPEPRGQEGVIRPGLFVIQLHDARRRHFDLRLEIGGVLASWAVPKGPSLDPSEKRLAVRTEDHPLEYADFEGTIPAGEYGAGAMIVWDRGRWTSHGEPEEGLESGKLLFDLSGYKLGGRWTLVRATGEREWLLIKKPDAWADPDGERNLPGASVLSGLTVEELATGPERAARFRDRLVALGAPGRTVRVEDVEPMLAAPATAPFSDAGWLFEVKYDGYRLLAGASGGRAELRLRSGRPAGRLFPEIARAVASLPFADLVVDGEVVVLGEDGRPDFGRLQSRAGLRRWRDVERATVVNPVTLMAFDLLAFEGHDLRPLPLAQRKELLRDVVPGVGPVRFADHVAERGEELFASAVEHGLEGLIAKRAASPYRPGRHDDWRKVPARRTGRFAVVGYRRGKGGRGRLGALHLAYHGRDGWSYAGRVGSGLSPAEGVELADRLDATPARRPVVEVPDAGPEDVWVAPRLVAEVRFTEWTASGRLRQPTVVRVREEGPEPATSAGPRPEAPAVLPQEERPDEVVVSRPEKLLWPADGITKGDLVEHYRAMAPWILPYLRDRPLAVERYPDGIEGASFFQRTAPDALPPWMEAPTIRTSDGDEIRPFVCASEEDLAWLANLAAVPLHVWSSRIGSLDRPDWCILDLDAKEAPFADAVRVARELRILCASVGVLALVKTSGASGLHVLLPMGARWDHRQARLLAELLARIVAGRLPEIASVARLPAARRGKVYVDFLQNGEGRLLAAPYCVRPLPGAPVSTPLRWRELRPGLDPRRFTLRTVRRRLAQLSDDPLAPVLGEGLDLPGVVAGLEELGNER